MKIIILGPVASGKTTLAKVLSEETNIPFFQMDEIVHDDIHQVKRDDEEQKKLINSIIKKNKEWIIEGMPRNQLDLLASNATSILYLNVSKKKLRKRLWLRSLKIKLGLEKANYQLDKELYQRMLNYIKEEDNHTLKEVSQKYPSKVIILKNQKEIEIFLKALKEGEILKYQ